MRSNDAEGRLKEVDVEERLFSCPCCNSESIYLIYPVSTPSPFLVECSDCQNIYWWSRSLEKLFDNISKQETSPNAFILLGKSKMHQLNNVSD